MSFYVPFNLNQSDFCEIRKDLKKSRKELQTPFRNSSRISRAGQGLEQLRQTRRKKISSRPFILQDEKPKQRSREEGSPQTT